MMKKYFFYFCIIFIGSMTVHGWNFSDVNLPGSSTAPDCRNSGISWRPQGDYAILAFEDVLYRYDYPSGVLDYQIYGGETLRRVQWAPDGSYAVITGFTRIYRYEHSATGFGTLTEITDIEGTDTITFYDISFNPADDSEPAYIACNVDDGGSHNLEIFRYDPLATPQVYSDWSGGIGPGSSYDFEPITVAFQADGDYMVIGCRQPTSHSHGFFVFDPDQSTFPAEIGNVMQYYGDAFYIGNTNTLCMSPSSGKRFVLVRGNGRVVRYTQQSAPAEFILDYPDWYTATSQGDSGYNSNGSICIFLERQGWSPHEMMVNDENGDEVSNAVTIQDTGFTNQTIRLTALEWHPTDQMGLMAGQDQWIFRFDSDPIPTPAATATATPESHEVPASTPTGIILLLTFLGGMLIMTRRR